MTDLYGSTDSLEALHSTLAHLLGAVFELRHSHYRGGDYFIANPDEGTQYVIQLNYNSFLGEWSYPEYHESTTLFFATGTEGLLASLLANLSSVTRDLKPLERTDLSPDGKIVTSHWNGLSFV
jgi:hypothetical protein